MDEIVEFLKREGPQLSTAVTAYLCRTLGISETAARQRVSRSRLKIKRLGLITFPKRARFLYLEQQFASPYYWTNLRLALIKHKTAYGYALLALISRGGICLEEHFPIICGSPHRQKGHLSTEVVLEKLINAGLLKRHQYEGQNLIALAQNESLFIENVENMLGRLTAETALLGGVKSWLKKLNIVSYNSVKTRDDTSLPMVATYAWDLSAPSYLSPLLKRKTSGEVHPGFWVCDVYLGKMGLAGAQVFLQKCKTLRALRTVAPTMQMIISENYSEDAFQLLKRNGVIVSTVQTLFGAGTAGALKSLASAFTASLHRKVDVDQLDKIMGELKKHKDQMGNIRGVFFELLVRDVVKLNSAGSPSTTVGVKVKHCSTEAEIDVVVYNPKRGIRFIETKACNPKYPLDDKEVDRWIDHNIKTVFAYSQTHPDWQKEKISFELWSTANLSTEALNKITQFRKKNARRYGVRVLNKDEILNEFKETQDVRLIQVVKNHFL